MFSEWGGKQTSETSARDGSPHHSGHGSGGSSFFITESALPGGLGLRVSIEEHKPRKRQLFPGTSSSGEKHSPGDEDRELEPGSGPRKGGSTELPPKTIKRMLENPLRKKLKEVPFVGTFNRLAPYEELGTRERYVPLETVRMEGRRNGFSTGFCLGGEGGGNLLPFVLFLFILGGVVLLLLLLQKTKPFTPPQPRGLEVFSELVSMELEETQKFMTQYPHRSFWKNEEGDDDAILKFCPSFLWSHHNGHACCVSWRMG